MPLSGAGCAASLVRAILRRAPVVAIALAAVSPAPAQLYVVHQFEGSSPGQTLGWSVAGAGDVNGDGFDDLIVASPSCQFFFCGLAGLGAVQVLSGATGGVLHTFPGSVPDDRFGFSVAGAGDVNGDGFDDVIVGAFGVDVGVVLDAGQATVYSGTDGLPLLVVSGTTVNEQVGYSVSGAGDVNGDGFDDVIVGARGGDPGSLPFAGRATVYSGGFAPGAVLFSAYGSAVSDFFGSAVAGAGDVNADGYCDVVVGAPGADPAGVSAAGRAKVFAGGPAAGTVLHVFDGTGFADRLGAAVAGAGDVNGDGFDDILVGVSDHDPGGVQHAGQMKLFSGASGAALVTSTGFLPHDHFARTLAAPGDLDGDGVPDLLGGAEQSPPAVGNGYVRVVSGANGAILHQIFGAFPAVYLGWSVAAAGDVNGDGLRDFVVGTPGADPGGLLEAGSATVYSMAGFPPGSSLFGSGCPGTSGALPRIQTAGGAPDATAGNPSFRIVLSKALPNAPALLAAGASNTQWLGFGIPLPLSLAPFGFPNCAIVVSLDVQVLATTTGDGIRFLTIPVPANPSLVGQSVYFQWLVLDPPGAATQGLEIVL